MTNGENNYFSYEQLLTRTKGVHIIKDASSSTNQLLSAICTCSQKYPISEVPNYIVLDAYV